MSETQVDLTEELVVPNTEDLVKPEDAPEADPVDIAVLTLFRGNQLVKSFSKTLSRNAITRVLLHVLNKDVTDKDFALLSMAEAQLANMLENMLIARTIMQAELMRRKAPPSPAKSEDANETIKSQVETVTQD